MNAVHTPGPWILNAAGDAVLTSDGYGFRVRRAVADLGGLQNASETMANARLIAAAPKLLAVAKGALGFFEYLAAQSRCSDCAPDEAWLKPLREAIDEAEVAQ